ncbi:dicarboxylate/amino acid:cation symporter [Sphingomonas sp. LHG3406-1]|uniref:dicarboxylate/amino acid:cation symporter n=1 Tax=Sphingomonas sp. LHG3406-1 TaxID=2804617 RepID=UPI0026281F6F|nr:dicarboxylate/amino acid:cation symporter [Sphingomonas sp. LHG3406-1]
MLIGFVAGLALGLAAYAAGGSDLAWVQTLTGVTKTVGDLFLRLIFMLIIPLLVSALVVGIAEMGDVGALKRVGIKTLVFTVLVTAVGVGVALAYTNIVKPGSGFDRAVVQEQLAAGGARASEIVAGQAEKPSGFEALVAMVPRNVVTAMSENDILAVMVFSLILGIGLLLTRTPQARKLQEGIEGLFHVAMKLMTMFIRLAPIAVFCFMFNLSAAFGWDLVVRLAIYVGVVLAALGTQMFIVYPLLLKLVGGFSPRWFFRGSQEAMLMAFSTASSNATLPTALRVAETELKLPPRVARFVLTIGATANQNGTAIFEGVTVLFLAQVFGVELTIAQQLLVLLMCILGGIGTAGVPAGSLPVVALILAQIGVPPEAIGLVLGVDRFLDMCRTTLNVTGDLTLATLVSKGETSETPEDERPAAPPVIA